MTAAASPEPQREQGDPDTAVRVGGWLFERRTWLPVPLAVTLLVVRAWEAPPSLLLAIAGGTMVALGEALRLWGVHHIGAISRTRSDRLGPLVTTGPFALVRNPLYLGNIALWVGFALTGRLIWMAPVAAAVLGFEYHAIVRWEEWLLVSHLDHRYRSYLIRVPRWIPRIGAPSTISTSSTISTMSPGPSMAAGHSWRDALFSERGTLIAIAAGYLLLWLKLKR
jgi:protein-S-isoprenylcysteine O-methyltransferase Ste14